jgi:hypothetical protein
MRRFSVRPSLALLPRPKLWRPRVFGSRRCREHSTAALVNIHQLPVDVNCFRVDLETTFRYFVLRFRMLQQRQRLQNQFSHLVQRLAEAFNRSKRCLEQLNSRIRLFLSRAIGYTVTLPGQAWFSRLTALGRICVAEIKVSVTASIKIKAAISSLPVTTVMTAVECPPLRGEVRTGPSSMMIGARTATSELLGSTQGPSLCRIESTGADFTEMVMIEII